MCGKIVVVVVVVSAIFLFIYFWLCVENIASEHMLSAGKKMFLLNQKEAESESYKKVASKLRE